MARTYRDLIPWPPSVVAGGTGQTPQVADLGLDAVLAQAPPVPLEFRGIVTEGLTQLGVEMSYLSANPYIHRLLSSTGLKFRAVDAESPGPRGARITEAGTAWVDLGRTRWARFEAPQGFVRLEALREGVEIVVELPERDRALEAPVPALADWCVPLGDEWLREALEARVSSGDGWDVACAAGMLATLADMPNARLGSSAAESLEGMRPLLDVSRRLREWVRSWTAADRERIQQQALDRIGQLDRELSDLAGTVNPDGEQTPEWLGRLVRACHARDDVSGAAVLLEWAGAPGVLSQALDTLDAEAAPFVQLLLLDDPVEDERLRRVWIGQPDAWWGEPAALEHDDAAELADAD